MSELPTVRLAQPPDEEGIMAMCHNLHEENGLFTLSPDKVRDCIRRSFTRRGTIVGVIGPPNALQGSICMELTGFYYTNDMHMAELWNHVEEPYRRSRNAEALIEYAKDWQAKLGIPFFTGIITNKRMAGKVRLYRRLLGHPVGAFFLWGGNWKSEPMNDYTDLKAKLRQMAHFCATQSKASKKDLTKVASLLREAADILSSEGNIWAGPSVAHHNGQDAGVTLSK